MNYLLIFLIIIVSTFMQYAYSSEGFKVSTLEKAELHPDVIRNVRSAYRLLNIEIDITLLPAQRALLEAKYKDLFDAELGRIKAAEAILLDYIRIPVSLTTIEVIALTISDFKLPKSSNMLDSMKNFRVASIRGVLLTDKLLTQIDNDLLTHTQQGFEMLKRNRIDVFVVPNFMIRDQIESLSKDKIIIHSPTLFSEKAYHFLHKRHRDKVGSITKALSQTTGNPIEQ